MASDAAPNRRTLCTKPAHRPALGFLSAMTVKLAYLGSRSNCLYADARSPLRKAQSVLAWRMFLETWARWPHVGRVVGVRAVVRNLVMLRIRSSRALSFPPCDTPNRKAELVAPSGKNSMSPLGENSAGWLSHPSCTWGRGSPHGVGVTIARSARPFADPLY